MVEIKVGVVMNLWKKVRKTVEEIESTKISYTTHRKDSPDNGKTIRVVVAAIRTLLVQKEWVARRSDLRLH